MRQKEYGIRVHAWMNPYRVSQTALDLEHQDIDDAIQAYVDTLDDLNFAKKTS